MPPVENPTPEAEAAANLNDAPATEEAVDEEEEDISARLERLGGEPAPDITPEEFARLQQSGQIHIDPRGRVRSARAQNAPDAGVSLRKRRAWYVL
jgi:hypothetical protein